MEICHQNLNLSKFGIALRAVGTRENPDSERSVHRLT